MSIYTKNWSIDWPEVIRVTAKIGCIIFVVEGLIMMGLHYLYELGHVEFTGTLEAFIDATALTAFSAPLIAFFVIRPYIEKKSAAEEGLYKSQQKSAEEFKRLTNQAFEEKEKMLVKQKNTLKMAIKKATSEIKKSQERYELAAIGSNDGLWDWDVKRNKIYYSNRFKNIFGYRSEEFVDHIDEWKSRIHQGDLLRFHEALNVTDPDSKISHSECEYRVSNKNGDYIWVLSKWVTLFKDGKAIRHVGSLTDIHSRKNMEKQLVHDALHDGLTGLPNRLLFNDRLEQHLYHKNRSPGSSFAVVFVDIDDFKGINDTLGHHVGDEIIIEVAHRLRGRLRATDTVARLGGDEFGIILNDIKSESKLQNIIKNISKEIIKKHPDVNHDIHATLSMGVVYVDDQSSYSSAHDLLRDADIALYQSKKNGKSRFSIFANEMRQEVVRKFELTNSLESALRKNEITLFYQPVIDINTFEIRGFEALMRWHHPRFGWVSPAHFIPIAEQSKIIMQLGNFALDEACKQLGLWREKVPESDQWFMSINVSGRQLENNDTMITVLKEALDLYQIPAELVKIEITENILIKYKNLADAFFKDLKRLGCKIAIDDFGTGYSSLNTLAQFPFDYLKIDRSFISNIVNQKKSRDMVRIINRLASALKMNTIVEGIETVPQMLILRDLGSSLAQGYLFSKPMPPDAIDPIDSQRKAVLLELRAN